MFLTFFKKADAVKRASPKLRREGPEHPGKWKLLSLGGDRLWNHILLQAVADQADLTVMPIDDFEQGLSSEFDLIVLDASDTQIGHIRRMVADMRLARADAIIVVAFAAPCWRAVREVFIAGASDFVEKIPDVSYLRQQLFSHIHLQ